MGQGERAKTGEGKAVRWGHPRRRDPGGHGTRERKHRTQKDRQIQQGRGRGGACEGALGPMEWVATPPQRDGRQRIGLMGREGVPNPVTGKRGRGRGKGEAPEGTGEPGIKHLSIHERGPRQSESAQV